MLAVLRNKLMADTALQTLIVSVYQGQGPQGAIDREKGYVVLTQISGNPHNHLGGAATSQIARVQVDSWGRSKTQARQIADRCKAVLSGLRDLATTPRVDMAHLTSETDGLESPQDGSSNAAHRVSQDYHVDYH